MPETMTQQELLTEMHSAARILAGLDQDRAASQNGVGFSAYDSDFGHALAEKDPDRWSGKMKFAARKMLYKYRKQLATAGIDAERWPAVPNASSLPAQRDDAKPEKPEQPNVMLDSATPLSQSASKRDAAQIVDGFIRITFQYDRRLVDGVKARVPGRVWNHGAREWNAPPTPDAIRAAVQFGRDFGLTIDTRIGAMADALADLPERRVEAHDDGYALHFPYEQEISTAVRSLPGASYNGSFWTVPADGSAMQATAAFAELFEFALPDGFTEEAEEKAAAIAEAIAASTATDAALDLPGFGGPDKSPYPFQRAGIAYAVDRERAMIADEMGLGKTIQALGAIFAKQAFPAVIVCPASLKENWRREAQEWTGRKVMTLSGRKPADLSLFNAEIFVINYDVLEAWSETLIAQAPRAIVMDESHYVKNGRAKRTKACKALAKTKSAELVLLLTGTPIMNRPVELVSQLQILGRLDHFGGWKRFTKRYCGAHHSTFGYNTDGASHLEELNIKLRECCMVRRKKADVLTELPPKVRSRVVLPLTNQGEYDRTEADVIRWIGEQAAADSEKQIEFRERAMDEWDADECVAMKESSSGRWTIVPDRMTERRSLELQGVDKRKYVAARARQLLSRHRAEKETRAAQAEQLVRIEALKQVAVTGMLDAAIRWIKDFLETGEQLIVFATHKSVVRSISEAFSGSVVIDGSTSMEARDRAVQSFQSGRSSLIVGNLQAMGVGLTLTAASNVAFVELGWTPAAHDQAEDRAHRIGQERDSVTAHYLLPAGTIYEEIESLIAAKRQVVDAATDGEVAEAAGSANVLSDLVATLKGRAAA